MCEGMHVCMGARACPCIRGGQKSLLAYVLLYCSPPKLLRQFARTEADCFSQASCSARPLKSVSLHSSVLGSQMCATIPVLLMSFGEPASCLHRKHFIQAAVSPTQIRYIYWAGVHGRKGFYSYGLPDSLMLSEGNQYLLHIFLMFIVE